VAWRGVLITRRDLQPNGFVHWSRRAVTGGWVYDFCGTESPDEGALLTRPLLSARRGEPLLEYTDRRGLAYRAAVMADDGAMSEALLVAAPGQLPASDWLVTLLASGSPLTRADRQALLSGRSPQPLPSIGRIVCACFNVGSNQIAAAVSAGCGTVESIGESLRAGTNCGSCRAEIRTLIHAA
jgi:assimilatory nitrate reductase catalytic subunit